jgi:hypothetical protein
VPCHLPIPFGSAQQVAHGPKTPGEETSAEIPGEDEHIYSRWYCPHSAPNGELAPDCVFPKSEFVGLAKPCLMQVVAPHFWKVYVIEDVPRVVVATAAAPPTDCMAHLTSSL